MRRRLLIAIAALSPTVGCRSIEVTTPPPATTDVPATDTGDTDALDTADPAEPWSPVWEVEWVDTRSAGDCPFGGSYVIWTDYVGSFPIPTDMRCPSHKEVLELSVPTEIECDPSAAGVLEATSSSREGDTCSYDLVCTAYYSCVGRPLRQNHTLVVADATTRGGWVGSVCPDVNVPDRKAQARFWECEALGEHSSIAGFQKLGLDLLALGGPASLLRAVQTAAADEIRHAEGCFAIASAFAGTQRGPGPLPIDDVRVARDLRELALTTAEEGAIGETIGAMLAQHRLEQSSDPAIQRFLAGVAEEEAQHAELAWRVLQWAVAEGGQPIRDALMEFFADPRVLSGALPGEDELIARCMDEVIGPVSRALLADRAA